VRELELPKRLVEPRGRRGGVHGYPVAAELFHAADGSVPDDARVTLGASRRLGDRGGERAFGRRAVSVRYRQEVVFLHDHLGLTACENERE
jgi:hypothetical protein